MKLFVCYIFKLYASSISSDVNVFNHLIESNLNQELIDHLCDVIKCKRLAIKSKVLPDEFRTPQVKLVKGLDPWVIHIDNNIK